MEESFEEICESFVLSGDETEHEDCGSEEEQSENTQKTGISQDPSNFDFTVSLLIDGKLFSLQSGSSTMGICRKCSKVYSIANRGSNLTRHLVS